MSSTEAAELTQVLLPWLEQAASSSDLPQLNRASRVGALLGPRLEPGTPTALALARVRLEAAGRLAGERASGWLPTNGLAVFYHLERIACSADAGDCQAVPVSRERVEQAAARCADAVYVAPLPALGSPEAERRWVREATLSAGVGSALVLEEGGDGEIIEERIGVQLSDSPPLQATLRPSPRLQPTATCSRR